MSLSDSNGQLIWLGSEEGKAHLLFDDQEFTLSFPRLNVTTACLIHDIVKIYVLTVLPKDSRGVFFIEAEKNSSWAKGANEFFKAVKTVSAAEAFSKICSYLQHSKGNPSLLIDIRILFWRQRRLIASLQQLTWSDQIKEELITAQIHYGIVLKEARSNSPIMKSLKYASTLATDIWCNWLGYIRQDMFGLAEDSMDWMIEKNKSTFLVLVEQEVKDAQSLVGSDKIGARGTKIHNDIMPRCWQYVLRYRPGSYHCWCVWCDWVLSPLSFSNNLFEVTFMFSVRH